MRRILLILFVLLLTVGAAAVGAQDGERAEFEGVAPAPPFPTGLDWINVDGELTLEELQGKVVLLDFWTYGCINCLHMIPVFEQLEAKYEEELVIIGVHSAKFENEGDTQNIQDIVQRYEVKHPVINDNQFIVWQIYERFLGQRLAWPTLVLIDPNGNVFAAQSGEVPFEPLDQIVGGMSTYFDTQGTLVRDPIEKIDPEIASAPPRALNFPGKILADPEGNRLFIADSVNHRLVIAALDTYEVLDVIGTGAQGYVDGDYDTAQFYKPQGMALRDGVLYVADTFNHTIRAVNLDEQTVETIAGTGRQGRGVPRASTFPALATDLRSPWDVEFGEDDTLYIASAGTHQIWDMDLSTWTLRYSIGNGREAQFNETLLTSELAQPSGLYYTDGLLYFADSESSTIRVGNFPEDSVRVVSGTTENNLFDYGDIDGALGENRLQHALGVDGDGSGIIYIADTYNSKIKVVDDSTDEKITETLSGGDVPGFADGPLDEALFNEPGGIDLVGDLLYVADTNNHAIRVIDLSEGIVSTVTFPNPEALQINGRATVVAGNEFAGAETLETQTITAGEGEIVLNLLLPEGYKINDLAPSLAAVSASDGIELEADEYTIEDVELAIPATFTEGEDTVFGSFDVYYCEAVNESLCFIERFAVEVPITVTEDADTSQVTIEREITPPEQSEFQTIGG